MKTKLFSSMFFLISFFAIAQEGNVGIGILKPDNSAILDLSSTKKGFLIPRMTLQERDLISKPAVGLKVYQIDINPGEYTFDGKTWNKNYTSNDALSISSDPNDWSFNGNSPAPGSFIGTLNIEPLRFKVQGVASGLIDASNANTFIGYNSGTATTGGNNAALGSHTLASNVGGVLNMAIGVNSLNKNISGNNNVGIGAVSLYNNTGNDNVAIGTFSMLTKTSGNGNVAIGSLAGYNNSSGANNVFIGYNSGALELGSNKLYIANSGTSNPLIKGDFLASTLKVNSKSTGFLAVGDFDAITPMPTPVGYRLIVQDGILTEKIKVALRSSATDWADYVFDPEYKNRMMSLENIEKYINKYRHLPNVPSSFEMVKSGLDVAQTSKMLMEKIEELTLYIIDLNKEIIKLKAEKVEVLENK